MPNSNPRRIKGRQKIDMKKITNNSNLQVTFSKRRSGLFNKASELSTLCNVQVALIVFSPGNKVFSFGDPSVDVVINRYQMKDRNMYFQEACHNANVPELNDRINKINEDIENEKKCSEELAKKREEAQENFWWVGPIEEMNEDHLNQMKLSLENLKKNVIDFVERQNVIHGNSTIPPPHFYTSGPSSSNNPMPLHQPPTQQVPVYPSPPPPPSHMLQNRPMMPPYHMFNGAMMHHHGFDDNNNMGEYGLVNGFC